MKFPGGGEAARVAKRKRPTLHFKRADVAAVAATGVGYGRIINRAAEATLIGVRTARVTCIDGWAAGKQALGEGGPAVILQRA